MRRRAFIRTLGRIVAGGFVANVAVLYSPGKPWECEAIAPPFFAKGQFTVNRIAAAFSLPFEVLRGMPATSFELLDREAEACCSLVQHKIIDAPQLLIPVNNPLK